MSSGDPIKNRGQEPLWFDAVQFDSLDQGVDAGSPPSASIGAREEVVLAAKYYRTQRVFGNSVVNREAAIAKSALSRCQHAADKHIRFTVQALHVRLDLRDHVR